MPPPGCPGIRSASGIPGAEEIGGNGIAGHIGPTVRFRIRWVVNCRNAISADGFPEWIAPGCAAAARRAVARRVPRALASAEDAFVEGGWEATLRAWTGFALDACLGSGHGRR